MSRRLTKRLRITNYTLCLLLLLLFAFCLAGCAKKIEKSSGSNAYLKESFADSISIHTDKKIAIEYCPDNTCDLIESPKIDSSDAVSDFALLYLNFISDHYSLDRWREKEETHKLVQKVINGRVADECRRGQEDEILRCVMQKLAQDQEIRVAFVRYDENVRNEASINLSDEITKIRLR